MIELPQNIDLDNAEFQKALYLLTHTSANIFLTGKAGTGKSTFLRYLCDNLKKKYVVLAPTGVAAVNVGGVTIHSFFQMPLRPVPPDDPDYSIEKLKKSGKYSKNKRKLLQNLELIIIDEVSMVRPDMIDFIDRVLRAVTGRRGMPFGGVQLLLVGDIFQLEPVVTNDSKSILAKYYPGFFFFNARVYASCNLVSIELKKIYRQTDSKFINLLDRMRINSTTSDDMQILNSLVDETCLHDNVDQESFGITLTTRRDSATEINERRLESLPGKEYVFTGEIKDDFPDKILPTDLNLKLKVDAQVMLIRNDKEKRWVNGTLARIKKISKKGIKVELENGSIENVEREEWQNIVYTYDEESRKVNEEIIGTFTQYPLKAAWALTIHKSQGLTFSNVTIDMAGGAFSAGQTYVALSRCRSLQGIRFINPLMRSDIIVSRGAADFSRNFNDDAKSEKVIRDSKAASLSKAAVLLFNSGKYQEAIENIWQANTLSGSLSKPSVRRLISRFLTVITRLRQSMQQKEKLLGTMSKEFSEMGITLMADESQMDLAVRCFENALELDSRNMDAMLGMATAFRISGKQKKAIKILDTIIKSGNSYAFDANMMKGEINFETGNSSGAALNYMAAHKLNRQRKEPIEHLADLYEKTGMKDLGEEMRKWLDDLDS